MGFSGIEIRNESECAIIACLSQLTPLNWTDAIAPGQTVRMSAGRVWFTLSVGANDPALKPTKLGTGARLTMLVGAAALTGPLLWVPAFLVTSTVSGLTSTVARTTKKNAPGNSFKVKGAVKKGVYANDRTYVIKGVHKPDGVYELYFEQWSRESGDYKIQHICKKTPKAAPPQAGYTEYSQLVVDGQVVVDDDAVAAKVVAVQPTPTTTKGQEVAMT